jgi:hypothetical protein
MQTALQPNRHPQSICRVVEACVPLDHLVARLAVVWHATKMKWPHTPSDDLRHGLEEVLSWRSFGPVEVYAVFAEWCEENGVEPPDGTPPQMGAVKTVSRTWGSRFRVRGTMLKILDWTGARIPCA